VVDIGPHILGIVKKVVKAPRGVGRCSLSLSPSESAAEEVVNSLTPMDGDLRPLFLGLCKCVITSRISVLQAS
jgi:hypothetical protein